MPKMYVVHLGNSKGLMEFAEDNVVKRLLSEHVKESLGVLNEDILFAAINSVSRGKGQDLFLRSFCESLQLIQEEMLQVPIHAVIVSSDMSVQAKFETELRNYVAQKQIQTSGSWSVLWEDNKRSHGLPASYSGKYCCSPAYG